MPQAIARCARVCTHRKSGFLKDTRFIALCVVVRLFRRQKVVRKRCWSLAIPGQITQTETSKIAFQGSTFNSHHSLCCWYGHGVIKFENSYYGFSFSLWSTWIFETHLASWSSCLLLRSCACVDVLCYSRIVCIWCGSHSVLIPRTSASSGFLPLWFPYKRCFIFCIIILNISMLAVVLWYRQDRKEDDLRKGEIRESLFFHRQI